MFLRICPYFPFNARICLNGHEWLACRLRAEGIANLYTADAANQDLLRRVSELLRFQRAGGSTFASGCGSQMLDPSAGASGA
jgi:hypothetical protein